MIENRKLDVFYHGRLIGTLAETRNKLIAFQYSSDWLKEVFP